MLDLEDLIAVMICVKRIFTLITMVHFKRRCKNMNVTSIAISIGTFILGFAANKLLDWITGVASKQLKKRTIDCNFHDFYKEVHRDIVITASGFPFFSPLNIKESLNTEKVFLLATPVGIKRKETEMACFSSVDRLTESFDSYIKANSLSETLEEIRREVYQSFL